MFDGPLSPPLPAQFDAIVSRPYREFLVRVTALLNMASDGMILTNHDHQIRVGVLTGKRKNLLPFSLAFQVTVFRLQSSPKFYLHLGLHFWRRPLSVCSLIAGNISKATVT